MTPEVLDALLPWLHQNKRFESIWAFRLLCKGTRKKLSEMRKGGRLPDVWERKVVGEDSFILCNGRLHYHDGPAQITVLHNRLIDMVRIRRVKRSYYSRGRLCGEMVTEKNLLMSNEEWPTKYYVRDDTSAEYVCLKNQAAAIEWEDKLLERMENES